MSVWWMAEALEQVSCEATKKANTLTDFEIRSIPPTDED